MSIVECLLVHDSFKQIISYFEINPKKLLSDVLTDVKPSMFQDKQCNTLSHGSYLFSTYRLLSMYSLSTTKNASLPFSRADFIIGMSFRRVPIIFFGYKIVPKYHISYLSTYFTFSLFCPSSIPQLYVLCAVLCP